MRLLQKLCVMNGREDSNLSDSLERNGRKRRGINICWIWHVRMEKIEINELCKILHQRMNEIHNHADRRFLLDAQSARMKVFAGGYICYFFLLKTLLQRLTPYPDIGSVSLPLEVPYKCGTLSQLIYISQIISLIIYMTSVLFYKLNNRVVNDSIFFQIQRCQIRQVT